MVGRLESINLGSWVFTSSVLLCHDARPSLKNDPTGTKEPLTSISPDKNLADCHHVLEELKWLQKTPGRS